METRVQSSLLRILPLAPAGLVLVLLAAAAAASGAARAPVAESCRPQTWVDWHVAVKTQCVTRTYVCHNMTPSQLLRDPRVAGAYEDALASNDRWRIAEMDILIGQIRAAYGCGRAPGQLPPGAPARGLPPGHPPIRSGPGTAAPALGLDRTI
jgi:hypothetical protein